MFQQRFSVLCSCSGMCMRVSTHASSTLAVLVLQIGNAQLEAMQFHALLFWFVDRH